MKLPVQPPVSPMLARLVRDGRVPIGEGLRYEPKWDGFRAIVFRDGDEVVLGSRNERPLTRYFPEVVDLALVHLPERCVVDGEIVIGTSEGLDFEALLQRIHPAASRVTKLSRETPASFVAFDLLALGGTDLREAPFAERRQRLEEAMAGRGGDGVYLTRQTDDPELARSWFSRFEGAGLDGVVVKDASQPYREGERTMMKVKHERTADCVVGGFRWHKQEGVGSLLLGLYDDSGVLHHVGVCSSFSAPRRREMVGELEPYRAAAGADHPWHWAGGTPGGRVPEAHSRWNAGRDLAFEALRPELVCEVAYDHLQGPRFRHATTFRRWRPDREPRSCTYAQLDTAEPIPLEQVLDERFT